VVIAFGVSAAVGVIFGYSPAKRASERERSLSEAL